MNYVIPSDEMSHRFFSRHVRYDQVDWRDLSDIVGAFGVRIREWYIDPARTLAADIHHAFAVMALDCILIDTLSQFVDGRDSSDPDAFKGFVRDRLDGAYRQRLPAPIDRGRRPPLKDVADVLYHGFRCGILHEAHVPPYGGVVPERTPPVDLLGAGPVAYATGAPCSFVVVAPIPLFRNIVDAFERYLTELLDRDIRYEGLRQNFKRKLSMSFGVDISAAQ